MPSIPGDLARQLGADPDLNAALMGASFLAQNAGKRSVTVNLKSAAGGQVFRALVRSADVVIENFRPGVMARLGLGYESLAQDKPGLVYCAISGFGQDGPPRDNPAYDCGGHRADARRPGFAVRMRSADNRRVNIR
jgi:formyl-CoA transferase